MNASKNSGNLFDTIAKNAEGATTTLVKQVNELANDIAESANNAFNAGIDTAANFAKNVPVVNSLLPFNNTGRNATTTVANNTNKNKNIFMNNAFTNVMTPVNNAANVITENLGVVANTGTKLSPMVWVGIVFLLIVGVVVGLMVFYKDQVAQAYRTIEESLRKALGMGAPVPSPPPVPAPAPADLSGAPTSTSGPSLLEKGAAVLTKLLPSQKEVFNINANDFTYYDAEPMCRALGAELATYDQVKEAWGKGANWCNYGWVKGQHAVYPTQKEFYEKLQSGPPDDQTACGVPGVNGGYFDNPEMRFGVNCYGSKPSQTANDVRLLEEKGILPQTPETLKINQQAQEYKERLGSIGVMPFSDARWSEY